MADKTYRLLSDGGIFPQEIFFKDPQDVISIAVDATAWLSGATVSARTITTHNVTKDSDSESSGTITITLSGGNDDSKATVAVKITDSNSQTIERTINVRVRHQ